MILTRETIEIPGPYNAGHFFRFLEARSIEGVEEVNLAGSQPAYARTLLLPGGPGAIRVVHHPGVLHVTVETQSPECVPAALDIARHIFDVDAPIEQIDEALTHEGELLGVDEAGIRLPGAHDLHEILLRAIIGQQITVARARAHLDRLTGAYGQAYHTTHPEIFSALSRLFPTPERLASDLHVPGREDTLDPDRVLRLPRRSIGAVAAASRACAAGQISTDSLTDLPGVGPWTAAYVRMRLLPERDAWLRGDVALVAGARRLQILPADLPVAAAHRELARMSERWQPWRAYAAMRLWAAAGTGKE